jgi:hypothetical protein
MDECVAECFCFSLLLASDVFIRDGRVPNIAIEQPQRNREFFGRV